MEVTFTCVGMAYADKQAAVGNFWEDLKGEVDVERGLCLAFHPTNPYDEAAIAIVYCSEWAQLPYAVADEILTTDVEDNQLRDYVIGYVTKDDIPAVEEFLLDLSDSDNCNAPLRFTIDDLRVKNEFPLWMVLKLTTND